MNIRAAMLLASLVPHSPTGFPSIGKLSGERGKYQFTRDTSGTGRNAACPCGSGKKFKKCCMGKKKKHSNGEQ